MHVAFGPATDLPSWDWVGVDTANALGKFCEVTIFENFGKDPAADIVVILKHCPPAEFVDAVHARGGKIVYLPIDRYESEAAILGDRDFLGRCDLVMLHSAALLPFIARYCRAVQPVEHHCRYALPEPAAFHADGYLLWVGAAQHLPYVIAWLDDHPVPMEVRLLTNLHDVRGRAAARFKAYAMGMSLQVQDNQVNGYPVFRWSEAMQRTMMRECRAAFDIKGQDFNQLTKPPTKAQQFAASGISFGCNSGSPVEAWFHAQGFAVAHADDFQRLTSRAYWEATQVFAQTLRHALSMDSVLQTYRQAFASILSGTL